jgi:Flp pilus assembly protein TadB
MAQVTALFRSNQPTINFKDRMPVNTRFRLNDARPPSERRLARILAGVVAFATGAVLVVIGVMFSLLFFAVLMVLALGILAVVWWKTRGLRRQLRDRPPGGRIIEGEAIQHRA